jgi:hypothetical protein
VFTEPFPRDVYQAVLREGEPARATPGISASDEYLKWYKSKSTVAVCIGNSFAGILATAKILISSLVLFCYFQTNRRIS